MFSLRLSFNGQHTVETVALVSGSRDTPVWCMIYDELEYQDEADIFANQMKYVKALRPYEIFIANIEAGNDKQLVIRDLVESYSLSVGEVRNYNVICAVSALERIFDKYGYHVLDRTLRLCVSAWEGDTLSLSGNSLSGIARLIHAFGDSLKDEFFKERLGLISAKQLARTAKERRPGSLGFAEAMLMAYNRKCKYPLSWSKLYDKNLDANDYGDVGVGSSDGDSDEIVETIDFLSPK